MEDILRDELNVKQVIFRDDEEDLVDYSAKANFRVLGKELGKDMKEAAAAVEALARRELATLVAGGSVGIAVAGRNVVLTPDKVEIRRIEKRGLRVQNEGTLTVALDTEIGEELLREGWVRDLVRGVQTLRKESGLAVTDRIDLLVSGPGELAPALEAFREFVAAETLATGLMWTGAPATGAYAIEAGDMVWSVTLRKAAST